MQSLWNREPVLILAAVQTALALALAFGVHLTVAQTGAIMAFVAAVLGLITRSQVTPTSGATGLGSVNVNSIKSLLLVLGLSGALLAGATASACGGKLRHVATVADATALSATEAADDLEAKAFLAKQVPTSAHKAFSAELSKVYNAEVAIARLIKAVPANGAIDLAAALVIFDQLKTAVTAALNALPAAVRDPIAAQLNKAVALAGQPLGK